MLSSVGCDPLHFARYGILLVIYLRTVMDPLWVRHDVHIITFTVPCIIYLI